MFRVLRYCLAGVIVVAIVFFGGLAATNTDFLWDGDSSGHRVSEKSDGTKITVKATLKKDVKSVDATQQNKIHQVTVQLNSDVRRFNDYQDKYNSRLNDTSVDWSMEYEKVADYFNVMARQLNSGKDSTHYQHQISLYIKMRDSMMEMSEMHGQKRSMQMTK